mmetsp:Transcript_21787/g.50739  ORF Transcript_21787/g.50739 Transcript_21787/m.50739 type:complete len:276 (-) Transcript_21787:72-899(-)
MSASSVGWAAAAAGVASSPAPRRRAANVPAPASSVGWKTPRTLAGSRSALAYAHQSSARQWACTSAHKGETEPRAQSGSSSAPVVAHAPASSGTTNWRVGAGAGGSLGAASDGAAGVGIALSVSAVETTVSRYPPTIRKGRRSRSAAGMGASADGSETSAGAKKTGIQRVSHATPGRSSAVARSADSAECARAAQSAPNMRLIPSSDGGKVMPHAETARAKPALSAPRSSTEPSVRLALLSSSTVCASRTCAALLSSSAPSSATSKTDRRGVSGR